MSIDSIAEGHWVTCRNLVSPIVEGTASERADGVKVVTLLRVTSGDTALVSGTRDEACAEAVTDAWVEFPDGLQLVERGERLIALIQDMS
ncbi:MAG: hypothetical protein ACK4OE_11060 [Acidovorax sp.]|uniref:hypothetical protein n=1 Tax=Acidovorax sp. TaxID=1872122 RepID=UPI00391C5436